VLELKGLTRRYDDLVALDDLSFTAAEGQLFGFAGPNGAGKTTPMRIVLGVLEPDAGQRVGSMPEDHGRTFSPLFACLQACHRHAGDAGIDAPVGGRLGACAQR
jgi:ABC-type multidrug transport system ATPase subunit